MIKAIHTLNTHGFEINPITKVPNIRFNSKQLLEYFSKVTGYQGIYLNPMSLYGIDQVINLVDYDQRYIYYKHSEKYCVIADFAADCFAYVTMMHEPSPVFYLGELDKPYIEVASNLEEFIIKSVLEDPSLFA